MKTKVVEMKVIFDGEIDEGTASEIACAMEQFRHVDEVLIVYQTEAEKIEQAIEEKVCALIDELKDAIDAKVEEVLGNKS